MSQKWSKAQHLKYQATLKRKAEAAGQDTRPLPGVQEGEVAKALSVDLNQLRERSFRSGLVTAMECILRELR